MMNTPTGAYSSQGNIPEDTPVFDVNAEKVGTVIQSLPNEGYFVVEKGMIFTHELYLPTSVIQGQDASGVRINLSKDQLKDDRFKQPPTGAMGMGTQQGYQQTPPMQQGFPQTPPTQQPGFGPGQGGAPNIPPQEQEPPIINR